jgi:hypothetical protein
VNPFEQYKAKFGEYPAIMGLGDSMENITANILRAVAEGKPLWTFYYDTDPVTLDIDI